MHGFVAKVLITCLTLTSLAPSAASLIAEERDVIARLCVEFEEASAAEDFETLSELVMTDATSFNSNGRASSKLLSAMKFSRGARRGGNKTPSAKLHVVEREIQIADQTAIVRELGRVHASAPQAPLRRTLVWLRTDDGWKLGHEHSSPYSIWEETITAYESGDQQQRPADGGVVFIGSSSIRGWKTLTEDFPEYHVLGRGFGGSQMIDSVLYSKRMVTSYKPKAVAVYAGDNDIALGKSAARVFHDFKLFVESIHEDLPGTPIGFIAIKPSISRWKLWPKMNEANNMVREFAESHDSVEFLDIGTPMFGQDGEPMADLFVRDGLHLTRKGYSVWVSVVEPWLEQVAGR